MKNHLQPRNLAPEACGREGNDTPRLWTIGHSTRSAEDFIACLRAYAIALVVDVRRFPASRRHPQFHHDALRASLVAAGIAYLHAPGLGGRRVPVADSQNTAWRDPGFRGYADHMETPAFAAAMAELMAHARSVQTAIMCAELLWWRCHRALIADWLKVRGWEVVHIVDATETDLHPYTRIARVQDGRLSYQAPG